LKLAEATGEPSSLAEATFALGAALLAGATFTLGAALLADGQFEEAERHLLHSREQAGIGGTEPDLADSLGGLVLLCARTGRAQDSLRWVDELLPLISRDIHTNSNTLAATAVVEAYLAADRLAEAALLAEESLRRANVRGYRLVAMRLQLLLGRIHLALGDTEHAQEYLAQALAFADEQDVPERHEIVSLLSGLGMGGCAPNGAMR
jgi:tetratricopeptide (TPR) repeat protein